MALFGAVLRLVLLILYVGLAAIVLTLLVAILVLLFIAAPVFLIGYIAARVLYWLYTSLVVWFKPDTYSRLHLWRSNRTLLIISIIGVIIWYGTISAVDRFGYKYLTFTYDMICATVDWAAPVAAERAIESAAPATSGEVAIPAEKPAQSAPTTAKQDRCTVLIAAWIPWIIEQRSLQLLIAAILAMAMLTLWNQIKNRARRTRIVERPEQPARAGNSP